LGRKDTLQKRMPKKGPTSLKINKQGPRQKLLYFKKEISMAEKEHTKGKVFTFILKGQSKEKQDISYIHVQKSNNFVMKKCHSAAYAFTWMNSRFRALVRLSL
jgi:hypothetical protein